jgi:glycosyltransferase involved in cell wall biosynthesis
MNRRLKIIISAYACNPYKGSESGVGWGWIKAISHYHDLHVITAEHNKLEIETAVAENPEEYKSIVFIYVHRKRWLLLERLWPPAYLWTYKLWQKDAYKLAIRLHKETNFDLAHLITYVGFRAPGYLWKLSIPFIWGPVGGLENTPLRFLPMMGAYGCLYFLCRNIINSLHKVFLTGPKKAFKKASGNIISATEGIRKEILRWYCEGSEVICEIGPPPVIAKDFSGRSEGEVLRLSWSGLHLPGKALPLLLLALAQLPNTVKWQLDILGKGPCTRKWNELSAKLGLDTRCIWHGWVARDKAVDIIHQSHIFVITSLKDLTSTVLLEALSQGVPVICPDHCGFSNVVNENCGIKLPIRSPKQLIADISQAILHLWRNEGERCRLASGALLRIADFSWEKKIMQVDMIYRRAKTS